LNCGIRETPCNSGAVALVAGTSFFDISDLARKKPKTDITFWHGHVGKTVTDTYSKLRDEAEFRKRVAEKVGLGFEFPSENVVVGSNGPKIEVGPVEGLAVNY
jgi:hypothetical protein